MQGRKRIGTRMAAFLCLKVHGQAVEVWTLWSVVCGVLLGVLQADHGHVVKERCRNGLGGTGCLYHGTGTLGQDLLTCSPNALSKSSHAVTHPALKMGSMVL